MKSVHVGCLVRLDSEADPIKLSNKTDAFCEIVEIRFTPKLNNFYFTNCDDDIWDRNRI